MTTKQQQFQEFVDEFLDDTNMDDIGAILIENYAEKNFNHFNKLYSQLTFICDNYEQESYKCYDPITKNGQIGRKMEKLGIGALFNEYKISKDIAPIKFENSFRDLLDLQEFLSECKSKHLFEKYVPQIHIPRQNNHSNNNSNNSNNSNNNKMDVDTTNNHGQFTITQFIPESTSNSNNIKQNQPHFDPNPIVLFDTESLFKFVRDKLKINFQIFGATKRELDKEEQYDYLIQTMIKYRECAQNMPKASLLEPSTTHLDIIKYINQARQKCILYLLFNNYKL